ncbi:MAG TPA: response regulator [Dongiaceae bacterium]|jgi:CheY-like chemotaxis protein|nr:response regulator [Dongiaceae bacterium]
MAGETGDGVAEMLDGAPLDSPEVRNLAAPSAADVADTEPLTILIVDDDAALRMTIQRMLAPGTFGRYIVDCAQDGGEAIEHIKLHMPDLIITDIYMPVSDGFELINWMRAQSINVPVLAMSGSGSTARSYYDPLRIAERLGAKAVLDKPFRSYQLIEAIDRILGGRTPPPRGIVAAD